MNALNIRTPADLRAFAYTALPVVSAFLVTNGTINDEQASLWGGLATALLGPVIAFVWARNVSTFRVAFYAVLGAVQAVVVGYGLATDDDFGLWAPIINLVVGGVAGGVASANTTNNDGRGRHRAVESA